MDFTAEFSQQSIEDLLKESKMDELDEPESCFDVNEENACILNIYRSTDFHEIRILLEKRQQEDTAEDLKIDEHNEDFEYKNEWNVENEFDFFQNQHEEVVSNGNESFKLRTFSGVNGELISVIEVEYDKYCFKTVEKHSDKRDLLPSNDHNKAESPQSDIEKQAEETKTQDLDDSFDLVHFHDVKILNPNYLLSDFSPF
mmetsp:Transcript_37694/g.43315  ORF Transcript_37694/g.43315 Transcript_37694/m.43315 type:complete len:200 (-) Transcript_37694:35-634(-)